MSILVVTYVIYLLVSILLTVWVARTLHRGGRIFLVHSFRGDDALADSVNRLLVVGFYLINLGFVSLALEIEGAVKSVEESFEHLSSKLGIVLLVLGCMHFFNLYVFQSLRRRSQHAYAAPLPPPPPPSGTDQAIRATRAPA